MSFPATLTTSSPEDALRAVLTVSAKLRHRHAPQSRPTNAPNPADSSAALESFLHSRAAAGRPLGAIDQMLLRQYLRHEAYAVASHAGTEPAPTPAAQTPAPLRTAREETIEAIAFMRDELKRHSSRLVPCVQGDDETTSVEAPAQAANTPRVTAEPDRDPLLETLQTYRNALQKRQAVLRRAAQERATQELLPTPGWYTLKTPDFNAQLSRLNELDARARRGDPTTLQVLASLEAV